MKYLVWKEQVFEFSVVPEGSFTLSDEGNIPERYAEALTGMHTAYSTGAGEKANWQDFLMTDEEVERLNDVPDGSLQSDRSRQVQPRPSAATGRRLAPRVDPERLEQGG